MASSSARLASNASANAMLLLRRPALFRPVAAAATLRPSSSRTLRQFSTFPALKAASPVSGQPASSNVSEIKENAKQEVKSVTSDIASAITGANDPGSVSQQEGGSVQEIESTVTSLKGLAGNVPKEAWLFGGAGFLPYVGTSLSTIYLARQVSQARTAGENSTIDMDTALALLHHVEQIQISYGAVILSFLGALHWGFEFSSFHGRKGYPRYLMGVFPVLVGWPTTLLPAQMALAAQWATFTAVWYQDSRATARGWTPKWYSTYRFGLTAIVGGSILLTMGATNYYLSDTRTAAQKLSKIKNNPKISSEGTEQNASPRIEGTVGGEYKTEPGQEAYVVFENEAKRKEEEEKKRQEEEEEKKKKQEEEAQKKQKEAEEKARAARDKAEGRA